MKKWQVENQTKNGDLIKVLLENRGIKPKAEIEKFLNSELSEVTTAAVKIDNQDLKKALARIKKAIKNK